MLPAVVKIKIEQIWLDVIAEEYHSRPKSLSS